MKKRTTLIMILCLSCITAYTSVFAGDNKIIEITAPEVKQMLQDANVYIVNNLSHLEFELQHIAGSINIPFDQMAETGKLPKDKDSPIIFYCMAPL